MARISVKQRLSAEKHKRNSVVVKVQPNSYRDEMHRIRVVRELLQTEESYVAGLAKLLDVCFSLSLSLSLAGSLWVLTRCIPSLPPGLVLPTEKAQVAECRVYGIVFRQCR